jgi:hypothetical protein
MILAKDRLPRTGGSFWPSSLPKPPLRASNSGPAVRLVLLELKLSLVSPTELQRRTTTTLCSTPWPMPKLVSPDVGVEGRTPPSCRRDYVGKYRLISSRVPIKMILTFTKATRKGRHQEWQGLPMESLVPPPAHRSEPPSQGVRMEVLPQGCPQLQGPSRLNEGYFFLCPAVVACKT